MNIHSEFYATPQYIPSVSAGFDAADGDELGECCVTPAGFAHMTHMLSCLAGGKLVVILEVRHASVTRIIESDGHPSRADIT